ncbi:MAG: hypothetical protein BGO98_39620 [Myxococcales bacterium 68-20]|nr:hypothetical protein [Myxococcales bacterium]OJY26451.1 MAG: hypothetical protein BGO98_39620 [Myxococcales bacterium 68-20]
MLVVAASSRLALADGPSKAECIDAYTSGQQLKKKGQLRAAHDRLLVCSRDPCPTGLQADCSEWLGEVQRIQPSIVVVARDESGRELTDVRVIVDGVLATSRLDGRSIAVDPGERQLRFETSGHEPVTQRTLIREGEKAREVQVRFVRGESGAPIAGASEARSGDAPAPNETARWPVWLTGGVTVAALGTFAGFGLAGVSQRSDLIATCNHRCSTDDKDSVDRKFLVADVALGVALIAGAATVVLLLLNGSSSSSTSSAAAP